MLTMRASTAFRDRGAGSARNQGRSTEEAPREAPRGGAAARVRGGT
jgi:plasminogen activator inhibitor 1 RNA-binding protein